MPVVWVDMCYRTCATWRVKSTEVACLNGVLVYVRGNNGRAVEGALV